MLRLGMCAEGCSCRRSRWRDSRRDHAILDRSRCSQHTTRLATGRVLKDKKSTRTLIVNCPKTNFIIADDALGALHASHARAVQALTSLAALLEKLLVAADEIENLAAPADAVDESRPEDEEGEDNDKGATDNNDDRKRKVKRAEEALDLLNSAFRETVAEALRQKVSERAVPFVLNLPSAAIAYLLLHAQIRRQLEIRQWPHAYPRRS